MLSVTPVVLGHEVQAPILFVFRADDRAQLVDVDLGLVEAPGARGARDSGRLGLGEVEVALNLEGGGRLGWEGEGLGTDIWIGRGEGGSRPDRGTCVGMPWQSQGGESVMFFRQGFAAYGVPRTDRPHLVARERLSVLLEHAPSAEVADLDVTGAVQLGEGGAALGLFIVSSLQAHRVFVELIMGKPQFKFKVYAPWTGSV